MVIWSNESTLFSFHSLTLWQPQQLTLCASGHSKTYASPSHCYCWLSSYCWNSWHLCSVLQRKEAHKNQFRIPSRKDNTPRLGRVDHALFQDNSFVSTLGPVPSNMRCCWLSSKAIPQPSDKDKKASCQETSRPCRRRCQTGRRVNASGQACCRRCRAGRRANAPSSVLFWFDGRLESKTGQ